MSGACAHKDTGSSCKTTGGGEGVAQISEEQQLITAMLRPPVVRSGTAALNRALFTKKVDLAAAAVPDARLISKYRKVLTNTKEILRVDRISPVRSHPDQTLAQQGQKCLILTPTVKAQG